MLGATSSSRPPVPKTSYWPSTREDRKASSPPAWTPVAREPIAVASGPGRAPCFSASASTSGVEQRRHAAGVGVDPAGPVDDGDLGRGPPGAGRRPVSSSTWRDRDGGRLVQLADDGGGLLAGRLRARR